MSLPRVLLDVDNVLADFDRATAEALVSLGGPHIDPAESTQWDIMQMVPEELQDAMWRIWRSPGYCMSIQPYPEAEDAVRRLRQVSEVFFVTGQMPGSRVWPWERHQWLKGHFDATQEEIVLTWAKYLIEGDVIVEDRPVFYDKWATYHPDALAILWAQPYNASVELPPNGIRTDSWDEVIHRVGTLHPRWVR